MKPRVTLENCRVGRNVRLNGGFFQEAVFLGDNVFGSNAHVRAGTIMEEQACAAHTVGLKQTLLFPFVTLGSLINFCDCFMAGGTSRKIIPRWGLRLCILIILPIRTRPLLP